MTASHAPGHGASPPIAAPVTYVRPGFPVRLRRLAERIPAGLGAVPAERHGTEVAIIGAGTAGMVAAYELMRLGLKPVIYEARPDRRAAALAAFEGCRRHRSPSSAACASRRPRPPSTTTSTRSASRPEPFPNPLAPGDAQHGDRSRGPDHLCRAARGSAARSSSEVARRLARGARGGRRLRRHAGCDPRRATWPRSRRSGTALVPIWDDRSFYDFVATSRGFRSARSVIARCSARSASAPAAGTPTSPIRCWRSCASSSPTATRTSA